MAVLSKSESDLIYKSWALAADEKEKHGGAFMVRLVLLYYIIHIFYKADH